MKKKDPGLVPPSPNLSKDCSHDTVSQTTAKGPLPPLLFRQGLPLPGNLVAHQPMVPGINSQPTPCQPHTVSILGLDPPQHSRLVYQQCPISEMTGMDPELLPVHCIVSHLLKVRTDQT